MEKKDWRTKIGSILNNNRVDILDKDGSELLNDLEELFNQELDKAREEGRRESAEYIVNNFPMDIDYRMEIAEKYGFEY